MLTACHISKQGSGSDTAPIFKLNLSTVSSWDSQYKIKETEIKKSTFSSIIFLWHTWTSASQSCPFFHNHNMLVSCCVSEKKKHRFPLYPPRLNYVFAAYSPCLCAPLTMTMFMAVLSFRHCCSLIKNILCTTCRPRQGKVTQNRRRGLTCLICPQSSPSWPYPPANKHTVQPLLPQQNRTVLLVHRLMNYTSIVFVCAKNIV